MYVITCFGILNTARSPVMRQRSAFLALIKRNLRVKGIEI